MTGILTGSITSDLVAIAVSLLVCVIAFYKWSFSYWKRKGVPEPSKPSIPFGNFTGLFLGKKSFGESFMEYYDILKNAKQRFGGVYLCAKPVLLVTDTSLIKNILQTDFTYFVNHGTFANEKNDPLTVHLFNMEDQIWKDWRVKLTPTFTTGKMKMMFETLVSITHGLKELLTDTIDAHEPINLKDVNSRFTTDVIASIAFGIESNSLKNPETSFRRYGRRAIEEPSLGEHIKAFLQFVLPHKIFAMTKMRVLNKNVADFFIEVVRDTIEHREKNNIYRKDFMHLLLQLRNKGQLTDDNSIKGDGSQAKPLLTVEQMSAQCFLFFVAGFETSSTVSTFALYEMAKNQEVQDKLRAEIVSVLQKHGNKLTYEALAEMPYLDQVVQESLRKYPPVPSLFRVCSKDYAVPDSSLVIEKGVQVHIPIMGLQRDPEYYPDPLRFDPDRFTPENKKARQPYTWLPFGEGPRICIGLRFGIMQAKVLISTVVLNAKLKVNPKTIEPLFYKAQGFITSSSTPIWLDVEKI